MPARTANVEVIAESAAETLSTPSTLELRSMALASNWPRNIVSSLTVEHENGELVINYPEELAEQIENLEYGDINSLPTPVLRPFIYRAQQDITKVIEKQALGDLMEMVGIV